MNDRNKAVIAITVCLVIMAAGLVFVRGRKAPAEEIRERLSALQASIEAWTTTHGGPPESLQQLGLPDEAIRDHWKTVFEYHVAEDGTITLTSYGSDGKPGGRMFRADTSASFTLGDRPADGS